jgi:hypothetical protein
MAPGAPPPGGRNSASLLKNPRLLLILISTGVAAFVVTAVVGFSGAYFTSTSQSPGNEFAAADVGLQLSQTGQIVEGFGMRPGDTRTGDQTVTNTGHRAALVLGLLNLDPGSPLTAVLNVRVRQTEPASPNDSYDGPLASLDQVGLGTLDPDESRTYEITLAWPASEDSPTLESTSTGFDFDWRLEAVP